jgi:archaellum biogenesis ATPase FlaH
MATKKKSAQKSDPEITRLEQVLLACFLESPRLIAEVDFDLAGILTLSDHREIWRAMATMHAEGLEASDQVLLSERSKVDLAVFVDLLATGPVTANFPSYLRRVRELARARQVQRLAQELAEADSADHARIIEQLSDTHAQTFSGIRHYEDIPQVQLIEILPTDYIVPAVGIARNTITLWSGEDGSGKTALAYGMAGAVAQGKDFLGMTCQQTPVLYLDLENPAAVAQGYVQASVGWGQTPYLRVWGTWNELAAPQHGNPQLLTICKESHPLVIVDPFRYFHDCDEDSSTEMTAVMKYLRACALCGGAVVLLHHPARSAEDARGRGSTAIRAGCDLAFLHTLNKETNLITLKVDKNRHGERRNFTIKADFEEAKFEMTDSTWAQNRKDEIAHLRELIEKAPGISTAQLVATAGGKKTRMLKLLEEGLGTFWVKEGGRHGAKIYFPMNGNGNSHDLFPQREQEGTPGTGPG